MERKNDQKVIPWLCIQSTDCNAKSGILLMVDLIVSMICSVDGFSGVDRQEADRLIRGAPNASTRVGNRDPSRFCQKRWIIGVFKAERDF